MTSPAAGTDPPLFDVVVVGAGPSGLTVANLLAQARIRTLLVERESSTVTEPRAVSIDDESLRTMQAAGLLDEVLADIALDYGSTFVGTSGRRLYDVHPTTREYGFPRRNAVVQPLLVEVLRRGFEARPCARSWFGCEMTGVTDLGDVVELHLRERNGASSTVRARYVVGADGARSALRKAIGARMTGWTYEQRWLIVDLLDTRDRNRQSVGLSDGRRAVVNVPGPDGRRRLEFMLHPHEDDATAVEEAFVRDLLARYGPDRDGTIVRKQVYTFHARVADRWRAGNLFLVGDAAHLSPPFAGQGMNSGIRDAHNLGWKLAAVLRGDLGPRLLETYQSEREPHARKLVGLAVANGRLLMRSSPWRARVGDSLRRTANLLPQVADYRRQLRRKPRARYAGFIGPDAGGGQVGRLVPQPRLELVDRTVVLMDDLVGDGFALLVLGRDAQAVALSLDEVGEHLPEVATLAITPWDVNLDRKLGPSLAGRDLDRILVHDPPETVRVLLVRPDRYVALEMVWTADPRNVTEALNAFLAGWLPRPDEEPDVPGIPVKRFPGEAGARRGGRTATFPTDSEREPSSSSRRPG